MGFPKRTVSPNSTYRHLSGVANRACPAHTGRVRFSPSWWFPAWFSPGRRFRVWFPRGRWFQVCLAHALLAACQAPAPVTPPEPSPQAPQPPPEEAEARSAQANAVHLLTSESCERDGNYVCAVEALARYIWHRPGDQSPNGQNARQAVPTGRRSTDPALKAWHNRLWRLTGAVPPTRVAALAQNHSLAPLWELRAAMSGSQSSHEQAARLGAWLAEWPHHPFHRAPPGSLARLLRPQAQPGRVALFLPLSGALAPAGRAVRDGFIAAYFQDGAPQRPALRIYDTATEPIPALYEQSLVDGMHLIVGPLGKLKLEALHRLKPELPVLGLNYFDADTGTVNDIHLPQAAATGSRPGPPFMRVGLAIEDEAATIATRLRQEQRQRLLAIHGSEEWATRGARALADAWPFDLELQEFADLRAITDTVGDAMRVAASLERRAALERLLNTELEFLPRARSDLDGVVAFVNPVEAAALAAALRFHFASHLPVYASSQSVRNSFVLEELNGFAVAEMPINLQPDPLWNAVKDSFGADRSNLGALRAFGMDAYRIVNHWEWVAMREPLYGATGKLQLAPNGPIHRTLAWGTVARGTLRPLPDHPLAQRQRPGPGNTGDDNP